MITAGARGDMCGRPTLPIEAGAIEGHAEIVQGDIHDLAPVGPMQHFSPIGPIAPGKSESKNINLTCPGHVKDTVISIFVVVEYRDVFEQRRQTSCGYTVNLSSRDASVRQVDMPHRNRNT
jgi:hypothetical protein